MRKITFSHVSIIRTEEMYRTTVIPHKEASIYKSEHHIKQALHYIAIHKINCVNPNNTNKTIACNLRTL